MIWFLCACFFLILSRYFPDWYGILCLGILLPIVAFLQKPGRILRQSKKVESEILVPLALLGAVSFPLGAMPQDFLNLAAMSILMYFLSLDPITTILPLRTVFGGLLPLTLLFFWLSGGEFLALGFVSLYWMGIRCLVGTLSHRWIFVLLLAIVGVGMASILVSQATIPTMGSFLGFLPIFFGFLTLKHFIGSLFSRQGYAFFIAICSGYSFAFFLGEPFFSPFLYFSFLQVGSNLKVS